MIGPHIELTADTEGMLPLKHLAATPYRLSVQAPRFQPLRTETSPLEAGQIVELTLERSLPVTGVVMDAKGGPAAGAVLRYRAEVTDSGADAKQGKVLATTDGDGQFVIDGLKSDADHLFVVETADGARRMVPGIQAGQSDVTIEVPPRRDLRVRLIGDLDSLAQRRGKPFVGVRQRYEMQSPNGRSGFGDLLGEDVSVTPTAEGATVDYRGLIAGEVEVTAGKKTKKAPVEPGVTEVVMQLPAKPPLPKLDEGKAIFGRVLDGEGRPVAGADVGLIVAQDINNSSNERSSFAAVATTDAQGNYRLPLDPALLAAKKWGTLWAHATGYGPSRLTSTGSLTNYASKPGVLLQLDRAEGLEVRLVDEQSQPVAGAEVTVVRVKVKDSIGWLIPVDWADRFRATTDKRGMARIPSFVPAALNEWRVETEQNGRVEYDQNYFLNVRPKAESPHFEFLVPDAGRIEGRLQVAGDGPQGVPIQLRTMADKPDWPHFCVWGVADVIPDGDGKFVVPRIAAGTLTAKLELPTEGPWRASVPARLQVPAGKTTKLAIPLSRGVRVRGLIRKQDTGEGYPEFSLEVIYGPSAITHNDMTSRVEVETDAEGYFTAYVPPGPIELRLNRAPNDYHHMEWWDGRSQGGVWGSRREVPEGVEQFELPPIDLAPTDVVEGQLVDTDGQPLDDWIVFGFPERGRMNSFSGVHTKQGGHFSGYVPRPYPPRFWQAYHRTGKDSYQPKDLKYDLKVVSEKPLVLQADVDRPLKD